MLKIVQAAFIGLQGVQVSRPHTRSCLRKAVCAGKSTVKFAREDGPYHWVVLQLDKKMSLKLKHVMPEFLYLFHYEI